MSQDVVAAASAVLGRELRDLGGLGGSDRSGVHRAADDAGTVVVKSYVGGSRLSWARERVGLGAAGPVGVAPRLLGVAADPPLVVMEDLGSAPGVADHLLATDPVAADEACVAWATALGRLHAGTHADRAAIAPAFAEAEGAVADDEPVDRFDAGVAGSLDKATDDWAAQTPTRSASAGPPDVGALAARLADTEHHALSPADVCPDNNLLTDRRLPPDRLRVGGGAAPGVGRGVPRRPVADLLVLVADPGRLRRRGRSTPTARRPSRAFRTSPRDAFEADVEAARACWALVSVSWSLTDRAARGADTAPGQPRHPPAHAAPARPRRGVRHCRGVVRRRGARAHPAAVG